MKLRQDPVLSKVNIFPILISTFGILVAIVGIIAAIYNLSKGIECSHGQEMSYCIGPLNVTGNVVLPSNFSSS